MATAFVQVNTALLRRVATIPGVLILGVLGAIGVLAVLAYLPEQNLPPTPLIILSHSASAKTTGACKVGQACSGPTVTARDPEGESLTYRFYDSSTRQPVTPPITAESGKAVTPTFRFNESGDRKIYMVVEDGAGHVAPDYPIIIPVENK